MEEMLKIPKFVKKNHFLRDRFFDDFVDGQKIGKRGPNQRKPSSRTAIPQALGPLGDERG